MNTKPLPWFRFYTATIDDERIRLLSFEDRWHYAALLCCKGMGILDAGDEPALMRRKVAVKLGLAARELEAMAIRLAELDLINSETFQPVSWDELQYVSDRSTERVREHRERVKRQVGKTETVNESISSRMERKRNVSVTAPDTDTDTDTKKTTTTCRAALMWDFLPIVSDEERVEVAALMQGLPDGMQQDVLDELASAITMGDIKRNWLHWAQTTIKRAHEGKFRLGRGQAIQADRKRRAQGAVNAARATLEEKLAWIRQCRDLRGEISADEAEELMATARAEYLSAAAGIPEGES